MLLTTIRKGGEGGHETHSMTIFLELLKIVHENDFLTKLKQLFWSHHHIFPTITISYLSLLNDIQV